MERFDRDTLMVEAYYGSRFDDLKTMELNHFSHIEIHQKLSLSLEFLVKHRDIFSVKAALRERVIPGSEILRALGDEFDDIWSLISMYGALDEAFLDKYRDKLNWKSIFIRTSLPDNLISKYRNEISLHKLLMQQKVSDSLLESILYEEFTKEEIMYHNNDANVGSLHSSESEGRGLDIDTFWNLVSMYQTLGEDFVEKYYNSISWSTLCANAEWSEDFIRRNKDRLCLYTIIEKCNVPEELIAEKIKSDHNTKFIRPHKHHKFSDSFIDEYRDNIDWVQFSNNRNLSVEQLKKYKGQVLNDFMMDNEHDSRFHNSEFVELALEFQSRPLMTIDGFGIDFLKEQKNIINWDFVDYNLAVRKDDEFVRELVRLSPSILKSQSLYDSFDVPLDIILDHSDSAELRYALLGNSVSEDTKLKIAEILRFKTIF